MVTARALGIQRGLLHVTLYPSGLLLYQFNLREEPVNVSLAYLTFKYEGIVKAKAWKASLVNNMGVSGPSSHKLFDLPIPLGEMHPSELLTHV